MPVTLCLCLMSPPRLSNLAGDWIIWSSEHLGSSGLELVLTWRLQWIIYVVWWQDWCSIYSFFTGNVLSTVCTYSFLVVFRNNFLLCNRYISLYRDLLSNVGTYNFLLVFCNHNSFLCNRYISFYLNRLCGGCVEPEFVKLLFFQRTARSDQCLFSVSFHPVV
jgi:hypothetical protein